MKAFKNLFTTSLKTGICSFCKKKFKPIQQGEQYCSLNCSRRQEWEQVTRRHSERLRREKPRPSRDLDSIIHQVLDGSPRRDKPSSHGSSLYSDASSRTRAQSTYPSLPNRNKTGRPPPLVHKRSMPEQLRARTGSQRIPRSPPPPYRGLSSAGNTPAHALRATPLPDDDCPPWLVRRADRCDYDSSSETHWSAPAWASSPPPTFSSAPSHYVGSPYDFHHEANEQPSPTLLGDSPPMRRIGLHNKSTSDPRHSPRPTLTHAPLSVPYADTAYGQATIRPPAGSNLLGLSVTPFLVRQPSHPLSFPVPPRRMPHPRYPDSALRLRPGYERRGPRPRSNSFGGFQPVRVHAF